MIEVLNVTREHRAKRPFSRNRSLKPLAVRIAALALVIATGGFLFINNSPTARAADATVSDQAMLLSTMASATCATQCEIAIDTNFTVTAQIAIPANKNITITSADPTNPVTLTRDVNYAGRLISLSDVTSQLTLTNIVLDGNKANVTATVNSPLVYNTGGTLNVNAGTVLQNNSSTANGGGIYNAGMLNMNDGEVSGNVAVGAGGGAGPKIATGGGGIYNDTTGTANIDGAMIANNTVPASTLITGGGGIYSSGLLNISNSTVTGNKALGYNSSDPTGGGGINVPTGARGFTISNTTISHNEASFYGGGLYVAISSTIDNTVTISNNNSYHGGGVCFYSNDTNSTPAGGQVFNLSATIKDNTANYGGGIWFDSNSNLPSRRGMLKMTGGKVSGNKAIVIAPALASHYGGIGINDSAFVMTGGEISGNKVSAGQGGGIMLTSGSVADIKGDALITGNTSEGGSGGGINVNSTSALALSENAVVSNNISTTSGGGGITAISSSVGVSITGNVVISGNQAGTNGGGMTYTSTAGTLSIEGNVAISGNKAGTNGGGLTIGSAVTIPVTISDTVKFTGNKAGADGGGIYITPTGANMTPSDYAKLSVDTGVRFANNSAQAAYQIDPADIPLHNAQILTHNFTTPFSYGYNNYDINYTGGQQVYTVLFDSNGGSAVQGQTVLATGTEVANRPTDPTRAGYKFLGWFADQALTQEYDFSSAVTGSVVIYAKWQELPGAPNTGSPKADPDTALPILAVIGAVALILAGSVIGIVLAGRKRLNA